MRCKVYEQRKCVRAFTRIRESEHYQTLVLAKASTQTPGAMDFATPLVIAVAP